MSVTLTQTCVHHVLRLRDKLLPPTSASTSSEFACSMCFPYSCNCYDQSSMHSHSSATTNAFLTPISRPSVSHTHSRSLRQHSNTNIETEKEKRRGALMMAAAAASAQAATQTRCRTCQHPLPSSLYTTVTSNASNPCRSCHVYTPSELSQHHTASDLWVCIQGAVYNLSHWARFHPGGIIPLLDVAGCDASDVFRVFHNTPEIRAKLPSFQIGLMGEFDEQGKYRDGMFEETPMQKDFHEMVRQLERDGQFNTDFYWYFMKASILAAMFLTAVGLAVFGKGWVAYMASSLILGMFWQQIAFLGHDLGHNAVRGTAARDWFGGWLVTALFGVSVQWWKRNHNVHHVVTNSLEHDPDIQHLPVLAITDRAFKGYYSTYFEKYFTFDKFSHFLVAHQHLLYYPVMGIARLNLYVQSIILVADVRKEVRNRPAEVLALVLYYCWLTTLIAALPNWTVRLVYLIVCHNMAGLTHVQITLSHFAMPVYEGRGFDASSNHASREHFLRTQFFTSLDIDCTEWMDWLHGGLQFQVTHHLLPKVPRHRLRVVREKYVKPFAAKHGLKYNEADFLSANRIVIDVLRTAAMEARKLAKVNFKESFLWQFMQADG